MYLNAIKNTKNIIQRMHKKWFCTLMITICKKIIQNYTKPRDDLVFIYILSNTYLSKQISILSRFTPFSLPISALKRNKNT